MNLRNIAIIAHVDHGKTTLVDCLLRHSGAVRANQRMAERAMDSNDLERERGITILAKCTSVDWQGTRINVVDTPGHADFGGEVERILSMVDGVLLLVDAAEGPMPQTKFVVGKALKLGLKPIVVINKVDKPDQRAHAVHDEVFDLFAALDASEEQLDFPTLFASAKEGWAATSPDQRPGNMDVLFETVCGHVAPPEVGQESGFRMLATTLERDPYLGRVLTGRIHSGSLNVNEIVHAIRLDGGIVESTRVTKLLAFRGLERVPVDRVDAGDIVAIAGLTKANVADTLATSSDAEALPALPIDPPTLAMTFAVNDSPLAGRDGDKLTSRVLRERLMREAEGNVAIEVREAAEKDAMEVAGRGELQLAVLIETMRREGFELSISRPRVLFRTDDTGTLQEPMEDVVIDVDDEFSGVVVEKLTGRRADLLALKPTGGGKTRLEFRAPSRSLIGYHGTFMSDTRGTGVLNRVFAEYGGHRGPIEERRTGVLIANASGKASAYALWNLEDRGALFVEPGSEVYEGMIVGEHSRGNDLDVNPMKAKQLSNVRAAGKDDAILLTPPRRQTLETAMAFINDDELIEVTPSHVRVRKRERDAISRKRASKRLAQAS